MKLHFNLPDGWKKLWGRYRYVILIVLLGVVLMLIPAEGERGASEKSEKCAEEADFDLEQFEHRLADTLSHVDGAGRVKVMLTLKSSSQKILAQDVERDRDGGGTARVVTVNGGSGKQETVSTRILGPQFQGALIVCRGGGSPEVRLRLTQAVSALTGLRCDSISVCEDTDK